MGRVLSNQDFAILVPAVDFFKFGHRGFSTLHIQLTNGWDREIIAVPNRALF